ncbi:hypothetical protein [Saccharothrix texasensis]|uniref:DUF2637 domain-containing protein n=1 Tax=Saccharothrix texasensis TaxID=103734 RepID=A0A3N1HD38_9PSEU|nr:hypothetical protein [Saccharothrix texasensis]ROP40423.1 hypothetical protein EDD40_5833 [Saccharothrix texasensis]
MSTYAENRRADKTAAAEQRRADQAMLFEQRRADAQARAERERADQAAAAKLRQERADAARARRAAARAAVTAWVSAHTIDLLFLPVVLVPAVLAWSAIAGFGHDLYGAPGWTMPLFSEAAMWAFAFARAAALRAGRPTGRLTLGVWVFAGVSGTLAFLHGLTHPGGGVVDGIVMALVAVGGVVVHQMVTAAPAKPRPTREQRAAARLHRLAARRVERVRRTALRHAIAELAADGTAKLVHRPGLVELRRGRTGRLQLVPTTVAGLPVTDGWDDAAADLVAEIDAYRAALPASITDTTTTHHVDTPAASSTAQTAHSAGNAETVPAPDADKIARYTARVRAAIDRQALPEHLSQTQVRKFLRCRAEHAAAVHRALFPTHDDGPDDEGGTRQEVMA